MSQDVLGDSDGPPPYTGTYPSPPYGPGPPAQRAVPSSDTSAPATAAAAPPDQRRIWVPRRLRPHSWVVQGTSIVVGVLQMTFFMLLGPVLGEVQAEDETPFASIALIAAVILATLAYLATYIATATWLSTAYKHKALLFPNAPRHLSASWAWFSWFAPTVQLWFPMLMVKSAWIEHEGPRSGLRFWWWTSWLVALYVPQLVIFFVLFTSKSTENAGLAGVAGASIWFIALLLWLRVVREVTAGHDAAIALIKEHADNKRSAAAAQG